MRLLIVTTVSTTLKAFLFPYADHFRSLGWQVDAMAHGAADCGACHSHFDNAFEIEWSRHPLRNRGLIRAVRRVRAVVEQNGYDIVHVHTPVASFITRMALAGRRPGRRPAVIYTVHGFHFQPGNSWLSNLIFTAAERMAGRWTDFLVTMNRTDELAAARLEIVSPERVRYMPGIGIDTARFHPGCVFPEEVASLRRRLGIGEATPLFVMIAEFHARKRHADVIAAFARMKTSTAHVLFAGAGPLRDAVERLARNAGLLDRVHFAGPQEDVRPCILAARATVLPSSQEGLPRSVMESLCCGVPVIGSDIRGTRDLLADGGGLLFPAGDEDGLASCLDWFADHPEKAVEMGEQGRRCIAKYDTSRIIALHEALYAQATGTPEPAASVVAHTGR